MPLLNIPTCIQDRYISAGGSRRGAGEKRGGLGYLPRAFNRLFKGDRSTHSRPEVAVVSEGAFDGDPYLDPWSENVGS